MKLLWKQLVMAILTIGVLSGASADKKAEIKTLIAEKIRSNLEKNNGNVCETLENFAKMINVTRCTSCKNTVQGALACLETIASEAVSGIDVALEFACPHYCTEQNCTQKIQQDTCQLVCCLTGYTTNSCCNLSASQKAPSVERKM